MIVFNDTNTFSYIWGLVPSVLGALAQKDLNKTYDNELLAKAAPSANNDEDFETWAHVRQKGPFCIIGRCACCKLEQYICLQKTLLDHVERN